MPENYINALLGGILIGISATLLLLLIGRIAGNSGIIGSIFSFDKRKDTWKAFFICGLILGPIIYQFIFKTTLTTTLQAPLWIMGVAGFLVGYGTRLGSGCTAGHGICGIARFSKRSMVATLIFMTSAILTYWLVYV